jgi:hypothetical protein
MIAETSVATEGVYNEADVVELDELPTFESAETETE